MSPTIRRVLTVAPLCLLLTVLWGGTHPSAPAADEPTEKKLSTDLALIPGEALGFAHVRVAEVWKSEPLKPFRTVFESAGPTALLSLDREFTPAPSTLDRVTTVVLPFTADSTELKTVTILAFSKPFDPASVKKQYLSRGEEKRVNGKAYTEDRLAGLSVYFADDQTLVFGDADTVPAFLKLKQRPSGAVARAVSLASTKPMVACLNVKSLPISDAMTEVIPEALQPLLKAETLVLTTDLSKQVDLSLSVGFPTPDQAKEGEKAVRELAHLARQALMQPRREAQALISGDPTRPKDRPRALEDLAGAVAGVAMLGGINSLDDLLADPPMVVKGGEVIVSIPVPAEAARVVGLGVVSAGIGLPMVQKVRNSAARLQSINNLKQIALAMHSYHDTYGSFPPAAICDKKGKKLLSWRVAILPFIEQDNLYRQFKLDEPWDSEHNKQFSEVIVKTYVDPRADLGDKRNYTHYKLFVGGGSPFDTLMSSKLQNIFDGTSNTVMVVAAGDPVPWAKPDDIMFDPKKELLDLSQPFGELVMAFCDGSVRTIRPKDVKNFDSVMKLMIQSADGNVIPDFDK